MNQTVFCACVCAGLALGVAAQSTIGSAPQDPELSPLAHSMGEAKGGISVDIADRTAVAAFYETYYRPSQNVAAGWSGELDFCEAGDTSEAYLAATLLRINYFRAMAGIPADIVSDSVLNARCQEAALMMAANGMLSHTPPESWLCATTEGRDAAGKSNLALGASGPAAINLYMQDYGSNNTAVGHRRWILFPPQTVMGTGSVTAAAGTFSPGAHALWVINGGPETDASQDVAWPPAGYVPYQIAPSRWSYSYPGADFADATVSVTQDETPVTVTVYSVRNGFGDNTLVWELPPLPVPTADVVYAVSIDGAVIDEKQQTIEYEVIVFDPLTVDAPDPDPDPDPDPGPGNSLAPMDCAAGAAEPGPLVGGDLCWIVLIAGMLSIRKRVLRPLR